MAWCLHRWWRRQPHCKAAAVAKGGGREEGSGRERQWQAKHAPPLPLRAGGACAPPMHNMFRDCMEAQRRSGMSRDGLCRSQLLASSKAAPCFKQGRGMWAVVQPPNLALTHRELKMSDAPHSSAPDAFAVSSISTSRCLGEAR